MSAKPLAEVYEKLKEHRRQGEVSFEESRTGRQLRAMAEEILRQDPPEHLAELTRKLLRQLSPNDVVDKADQSLNLARTLDIKTLADRVFGEEEKAEAWLHRPNASLSGQRPVDLLEDELGAAVVREMLERIDHGIFA